MDTALGGGLKRRICLMQSIHLMFVLAILIAGVVSLVILSSVIATPIRNCPVVNVVYTVFWLSLAIAVMQTCVACAALIWFVSVVCRCGRWSSKQHEEVQRVATRTVTGAVGRTGDFFPKRNGSGLTTDEHDTTFQSGMFVDQTLCPSQDSRSSSNLSRIRSCMSACCTSVGWLQVLTIFVIILVLGQVVGLILSLKFTDDVDSTYHFQLMNIFVETKTQYEAGKPVYSTAKPGLLSNRYNAATCWDTFQSLYQCCGAESYLDWISVSVPQLPNISTTSTTPSLPLILPSSCDCHTGTICTGPIVAVGTRQVHASGCIQPVKDKLHTFLFALKLGLGISLCLLLLTFILDLVFTLWTAHTYLNEVRISILSPPPIATPPSISLDGIGPL